MLFLHENNISRLLKTTNDRLSGLIHDKDWPLLGATQSLVPVFTTGYPQESKPLLLLVKNSTFKNINFLYQFN